MSPARGGAVPAPCEALQARRSPRSHPMAGHPCPVTPPDTAPCNDRPFPRPSCHAIEIADAYAYETSSASSLNVGGELLVGTLLMSGDMRDRDASSGKMMAAWRVGGKRGRRRVDLPRGSGLSVASAGGFRGLAARVGRDLGRVGPVWRFLLRGRRLRKRNSTRSSGKIPGCSD